MSKVPDMINHWDITVWVGTNVRWSEISVKKFDCKFNEIKNCTYSASTVGMGRLLVDSARDK